jgi:LPXTG-site transpeptidase (sortase) family protein
VTESDHHHQRRRSSDLSRWRSDHGRPLIVAAGIAAIILVAAGVAFLLGGGPGGLGGATASPTASASSSQAAGIASPALPATPTAATPSGVPPQSVASGSPAPAASIPTTADGEPGIQANHIKIDRLGIDLAVIQGDGIDAPIGKAAHFPSSGWPGGGTNIYIYGHARVGMFIRLWDARIGDTVQLGLVDGTTRRYVVTKIVPTVPWDAVEYLAPTPTEQLTLQTSTSYYPTAPRFVVIALPAP